MTTIATQPRRATDRRPSAVGAPGLPAGDVRVVDAPEGAERVLTPEALGFLAELHDRFAWRRAELLATRMERRRRLAEGGPLDFLPQTRHIREDREWRVAPPAPGLEDRRVEITGPTDRRTTVDALSSGAQVWLADLEDGNTPHLDNVVGGQVNLYDAVRRTLADPSPAGKHDTPGTHEPPTIVVRPRGWHLTEKHLRAGGRPMVGGLVDVGLYLVHNAAELVRRGSGPYFCLPKLESHLEARLWNDVFTFAEDRLGLERGTIRATVLIETITAAFEMEEILFELREHSAGLNAGRWDYVFSLIKNFRDRPEFVLPDRSAVTTTVPFVRACTELLVRTCHRRGAHAIGGRSAFVPSADPRRNREIDARVRADKQREADAGYDGSQVAHPGLVAAVRDVFDGVLGFVPNQLERRREDVHVTAAELLDVASTPGCVTAEGLRTTVAVSLRYLEAWLGGRGAVAILGLVEDAATAEVSRSQLWQWIHHRTRMSDGRTVTRELAEQVLTEEERALVAETGDDAGRAARVREAAALLRCVALTEDYPTFLTIPAYASHVR